MNDNAKILGAMMAVILVEAVVVGSSSILGRVSCHWADARGTV
jgi:hypothetical protein